MIVTSQTRGPCDRCGANVQAHEDCTYLEEVRTALRGSKRPFCGFSPPRHIACSPSRAQARDLMVSAALDMQPDDVGLYDSALARHIAAKVQS